MVQNPASFALERAAGADRGRLVIGVDEVGRGPWAGPVVAAAAGSIWRAYRPIWPPVYAIPKPSARPPAPAPAKWSPTMVRSLSARRRWKRSTG